MDGPGYFVPFSSLGRCPTPVTLHLFRPKHEHGWLLEVCKNFVTITPSSESYRDTVGQEGGIVKRRIGDRAYCTKNPCIKIGKYAVVQGLWDKSRVKEPFGLHNCCAAPFRNLSRSPKKGSLTMESVAGFGGKGLSELSMQSRFGP